MQNSHFTAHVKITETFPAVTDDYGKLKSDRKVTDVTEFTVRADSYEKLVERLTTILPSAN